MSFTGSDLAHDPVRLARIDRRAAAADRLLDALEGLVRRHRALALHSEHSALHAELIAAEVAHELSMTRSALRRIPPLSRED